MDNETIVAIFDTPEHAAAAVADLVGSGIPASAITQHAGSAAATSAGMSTGSHAGQEKGFWSGLFGAEPDYGHDTTVYDRSLQGGSTVVTVKTGETHATQALDILERHNPIDIDERAATYGVGGSNTFASTASVQSSDEARSTPAQIDKAKDVTETLQLSEEQLTVGKRAVNRGTTRVRRYVVEMPVEQQVSLHSETVTIERHAMTDSHKVMDSDFGEKVIEMTETAEEAVVSKQAHVREEVVIRKEASDRTETVRDTVRREDVEIVKEPGSTFATTSNTAGVTGAGSTKPVT